MIVEIFILLANCWFLSTTYSGMERKISPQRECIHLIFPAKDQAAYCYRKYQLRCNRLVLKSVDLKTWISVHWLLFFVCGLTGSGLFHNTRLKCTRRTLIGGSESKSIIVGISTANRRKYNVADGAVHDRSFDCDRMTSSATDAWIPRIAAPQLYRGPSAGAWVCVCVWVRACVPT